MKTLWISWAQFYILKISRKDINGILILIQTSLIKKAVSIRKHLEKNRKDKDSKYRLILVESRIHRLTRYYRK